MQLVHFLVLLGGDDIYQKWWIIYENLIQYVSLDLRGVRLSLFRQRAGASCDNMLACLGALGSMLKSQDSKLPKVQKYILYIENMISREHW